MEGSGGFDDQATPKEGPATDDGVGKPLAELGRGYLAPEREPALVTTNEAGTLSGRAGGDPPSEHLRSTIFTGTAAGNGSSFSPREAGVGLVTEAVGSGWDTAGAEDGGGTKDTWLGCGAAETDVESAC